LLEEDENDASDEVKTLKASSAVMLTFGFRNYLIDLIEYPYYIY